ncbi:MAG: uracil-DNA glycosylase [Nitrospirota bacterium]
MKIAEDIRSLLAFYDAFGFEYLPLRIKQCTASVSVSAGDKATSLRALREEIGECRRCKLSVKRTNVVFGEGRPDAELMLIGEAPGAEEDLQGRPFVGDAGMLLSRLIERMQLRRDDVYIANVVKCRPPMNRDPEPDEIEKCRGFLARQIEIIRPKVIMSLGRIATSTLIGNPKIKITSVRGKFFNYQGIPLMPTFHPAYLIRNPRDKWLTWNDAQKVLAKMRACD